MFKKRRFKPVNKKMVSLSLAVIMLMSVPGKSVLSYAMTGQEQNAQKQNVQEQSVESESGYRLYADELTSDSGAVKGDITEVLPEYEIINVKLPDGSLAAPEEVNFPVTESGEYVFEVIYDSVPDDIEPSQTQETGSEEVRSVGAQSAGEQSAEAQIPEQGTEEQSDSGSLQDSEKNIESEELTLTITLPEAETEKAAQPVQEETQGGESEPQEAAAASSTAAFARSAANSISTRAGVFGDDNGWSTSNKTWALSDFPDAYVYGSNDHMDGDNDPLESSVIYVDAARSFEADKGVKFTFGSALGTERDLAHWLQQGAAFSDITFDFTKDFALEGYMRIGDEFGSASTAIDSENLQIDGGVTISFIPTGQVATAKENARWARGAAYRLGAYGTLPNSIVCEFDTSTDNYYEPGDWRNFGVSQAEIRRTGDYNYATGVGVNAWPILDGKDIYNSALEGVSGSNYQNVAHIGISTTGSNCYVSSSSQSASRVTVGSNNTGIIPYRIYYNSASQQLTFKIQEAYNDPDTRTVSYNLRSYFQTQTNRNLKLAFTYGAGYQNIDNFIRIGNNNSYFTGRRTGQIDIWAKEMYAVPNLQTGMTEVRWLTDAYEKVGASVEKNAYYNGTSYEYSNRARWPVAGDRIYIQNNFTPRTSLDPPTTSIQNGSLTLEVKDLSIKDTRGQTISGLSPPTPKLYYRLGDNGAWTEYTTGSQITVNGSQVVYMRIEMTLPQLNDNSTEQYNVTGKIKGIYKVGTSTVTHTLDLMTENNKNITVSRNPILMNYNGKDYYTNPRIIKSTDLVDGKPFGNVLNNVDNMGSETAAGRHRSIHNGFGYKPMSTNRVSSIQLQQGSSYTGAKFSYKYTSMKDLSTVSQVNDVTYDTQNSNITLNYDEDQRYILEYTLVDQNYTSKPANLTNNSNRGKSTGKRVIWASDNVEISNGYEFYAKQNVTMSKEEFDGFSNSNNKAQYYNKIAKAAGARVFKTADYNFTDKIGGDYTKVTGTGEHSGINSALNNPGTPANVTLRFTENNVQVERTISLTIEEGIKPITLTETGDLSAPTASPVNVYEGADGRYTLSTTFYMEGEVPEGLEAQYYVYSQGPDVDLWGSVEKGVINLYEKQATSRLNTGNNLHSTRFKEANLAITTEVTDQGNTKITLTYTNIGLNDLGNTGIDYRFYMWNSANSEQSYSMGERSYDNTAALENTFSPNVYPCNWQDIHVIPKVTTSYESGVQITETKKSALFYEETEFKVTGTFKLEGAKKENYDYLLNNSLLKVALYKKNPDGSTNANNYEIWANKDGALNGHTDKVEAPVIKKVGEYEFTVTYTIKHLGDSITHDWDETAKYRIFAWTTSNGNVSGISDFGQDRNQFQWDTQITNIPSTTTTMVGVLGDQVESIIHYPKQIAMMDNVKPGNNHIFSGDQKITMTPLKVQEGSQTVEAEVPDPDSGVDVVIQEIKDKQDADNSIKVSRTVGSGSETINLTCFLGTIESNNATKISTSGKVGTLYFASGQNEVPLYFRSSGTNPPNVADGATFTGQIHFIFSKSGSGN